MLTTPHRSLEIAQLEWSAVVVVEKFCLQGWVSLSRIPTDTIFVVVFVFVLSHAWCWSSKFSHAHILSRCQVKWIVQHWVSDPFRNWLFKLCQKEKEKEEEDWVSEWVSEVSQRVDIGYANTHTSIYSNLLIFFKVRGCYFGYFLNRTSSIFDWYVVTVGEDRQNKHQKDTC